MPINVVNVPAFPQLPAAPILAAVNEYLAIHEAAPALAVEDFRARVEQLGRQLAPLDRAQTQAVFDACGLIRVEARDRTIKGQKAKVLRRLLNFKEALENLKV